MGVGAAFQAVLNRWNSRSLSSTVTGGLYWGQQPGDTDPPYAVMTSPGSTIVGRASRTSDTNIQWEEHGIHIAVFSAGGLRACSVLAEAVKTAMDWAPLNISGASLVCMKYTGEIVERDERWQNGVRWLLMYSLVAGVSRALNQS